jgi:tungstate transport system ATP-binding protein
MADAAMTPPPVIELSGVHKQYGDSFTLKIDKLSVAPGETLCLVGPTGAGKTTLLRLFSGLDQPSSGRITWHDQSNGDYEPTLERLRCIATIHQCPLLLSETVRYNVEYGLKVRGTRSAHKRSEAILAALGLSRQADQDARTLSGGQVQLVAIARALSVEPEVLLLDEPTAHLDPANVALVENFVRHQKKRVGMTVVWATHNLFQARRMACRVGLLLNGQLIEVADSKTFFEHPHDPRTAEFVEGKMVY